MEKHISFLICYNFLEYLPVVSDVCDGDLGAALLGSV